MKTNCYSHNFCIFQDTGLQKIGKLNAISHVILSYLHSPYNDIKSAFCFVNKNPRKIKFLDFHIYTIMIFFYLYKSILAVSKCQSFLYLAKRNIHNFA